MQQFRNELFFSLLLLTGARPQELLNMNLNSFSGNRDKIVIKTGKGSGKTRQYPLDYKIQKLVSMYILEVAKSGHDKELNHSFFLSVRN